MKKIVSPVQLNLELGPEFLVAILDRHGVEGWNRWLDAMQMDGYMPLGWEEGEPVPPVWYWLDLGGGDLSGRDLDGIDLTLAWLRRCRFDESSLVDAHLGGCPLASFRGSDLHRADFEYGDVTGADFSHAELDGIRLRRATYDEGCPPIGLPDELMRLCRPTPAEPPGRGEAETIVPIRATLTATRMPE